MGMSPQTKINISVGLVTLVAGAAGALIGAGASWASSVGRLTTVERDVSEVRAQVQQLSRMQLSVARIEQGTIDILRRIEMIERDK